MKCKHPRVNHVTWNDEVIRARCGPCGAEMSIGRSNDRGIGDEIRAARWFASMIDEWRTVGPARTMPRSARPGWSKHAADGDPSSVRDGWLLREMYIVRADLDEVPLQMEEWPWDPSRPVAGQFEEWVKRTDANIAAMEDNAANQFLELTGPTDQGQPVAPLTFFSIQSTRCTACGHRHGGSEVAFICIGCPCPEQPASDYEPASGPSTSRPTDAFLPEDSATVSPWADPTAETKLTDDELITRVAYSPPGSVRE